MSSTEVLTAACLLFLTGCGSLPLPHKTMPIDGTVRVEGVRGHLSVQQSRAIFAKLDLGSPKTSIFTRHLVLEEVITEGPLLAGNKVTLLLDGPSTYKSMYAAIADAKNHVNMEAYNFEDDEVGHRFMAALIKKQREGVQVNFIYGSLGSSNTSTPFFKPLLDSGANVLEFNPVNPLMLRKGWESSRDHRKLLVVAGRSHF
jgi:cardiolipin synthase